MSDRREDPSPGTRLGSWRAVVPIAVAIAAALLIGGAVDVVQSRQRDADAAADTAAEPGFVVGVTRSGSALLVRDAETGEDIGMPVGSPEGSRFQRVAAVEDGSYVVASYTGQEVTFQRLTLKKKGEPKELEGIPEATLQGVSTEWSELAVSPDGDRIAYVTYEEHRGRVEVVSTGSGTRKVWTTRSPGRMGSLSWSGSTLSFVWSPVRMVGATPQETKHELRMLDTGMAEGDLNLTEAVMPLPDGSTTAILRGDTVVAGVMAGSELYLREFTKDGAPAGILWQKQVRGDLTGLDVAPDGGSLLATAGDLYTEDGRSVPGQDLADATW